jgi:hypothetical protein
MSKKESPEKDKKVKGKKDKEEERLRQEAAKLEQ